MRANAHWQKQRRREQKDQIIKRLHCFEEKAETVLALCTGIELPHGRTRAHMLLKYLKRELDAEAKHAEHSTQQDVTGLKRAVYSPTIHDALMLLGDSEQLEVEPNNGRCNAVLALLKHLQKSRAILEKLR